jgi:phosphohistidine phosphatase
MRRLLLLRHAKTQGFDPGRNDRDRVLVDRGRGDAAKIGAYMASHSLTPDRVIVSPAARAQETWTLMAQTMRPAPQVATLEQIYEATVDDILAAILGAPADARALLIVGHNPSLHETALALIASGNIDAREALREKLPTTGLVVIDFAFDDWSELHPRGGRLDRFVTPRSLEAISR